VAGVLAASVALSRVLGYVREAVLSRVLGVGPEVDAYRAAFMLPDLLNYFLAGGALSIAFIPFYTRVRDGEGEAAAQRFLAVVMGTTGALAVLVTVAMWLGADRLIALQFPRFDPEQTTLTIRLTRILLPAQIFFIAGGVLRGALMARGHFAAQSAAPVLYNGAIIACGLALGPQLGAEGFAWGALLGALLGPFGAAWLEARRVEGLRFGVRISFTDRALRSYLVAAVPLMFGVTLLTVDEWYDKWFGGLLAAGSIAALGYARVLMQLPVAIVGQAIATAALPTLSRFASEGREDELNETLLGALRAGLSLACLGAVAAFVFAEPLVRLVFEGGRFGAEDTARVATLLRIFAFAVPAWIGQQISVRGFYARGDTWRPMWLGTVIASLAVLLYFWLGQQHGAPGLAAAGAIGMSINAGATLLLLRALHGGPSLDAIARTGARAVAIALAAGVVAMLVPSLGSGAIGAVMQLVVGGAVFGGVALVGVRMIGDAPQREAVGAVTRRLRRR
jgi:putative peptidoglycan lipid II flippase